MFITTQALEYTDHEDELAWLAELFHAVNDSDSRKALQMIVKRQAQLQQAPKLVPYSHAEHG